MNIIEIIEKKARKEVLSKDEIDYFVINYTNGVIADYQAASLLMAIKINGMSEQETTYLTDAMLHSGALNDLSAIDGVKVDKHSSGGVGDKTSIVLGPIVAACGLKMAKMSGRGLGHTGGTIDKLESIPGFTCFLSKEKFFNNVKEIGLAIIAQSEELVPADKLMYALRDVTGTIDSMPLICSSIVSKKLASGADIIELDVKYGSGAFMKTYEDANKLATLMKKVGKNLNKNINAVISDMNNPLGHAIGNSLEVIECIETLKDKGDKNLLELCLNITSFFLVEAKRFDSKEKAYEFAYSKVKDGTALDIFRKWIAMQGGNNKVVDDYSLFKQPKYKYEIHAPQDGIISQIVALDIGHASMLLGAGRMNKEDIIDPSAGIILNHIKGESVKKGELLATLYTDLENIDEAKQIALNAFKF